MQVYSDQLTNILTSLKLRDSEVLVHSSTLLHILSMDMPVAHTVGDVDVVDDIYKKLYLAMGKYLPASQVSLGLFEVVEKAHTFHASSPDRFARLIHAEMDNVLSQRGHYEFTKRLGQRHAANADGILCGMPGLGNNHASRLSMSEKMPCLDCLKAFRKQTNTNKE